MVPGCTKIEQLRAALAEAEAHDYFFIRKASARRAVPVTGTPWLEKTQGVYFFFLKKHACRSASLEHGQAATPEAMLGHLPV